MSDFKVNKVLIGDRLIDQLTDENGINWYPLSSFFKNILHKDEKISSFRDSKICKYMQVIEYNPNIKGANRDIKMWFINEKGIKYILKNITIKKIKKTWLYNLRKKSLYEACLFFNVKKEFEERPTYINTPPKLNDYDMWSIICLEYDKHIYMNEKWKICPACNYYYPYRERYFGHPKRSTSKCLQCQGKDFKCQNKIIQYIYDNDGFELIYQLRNNDDTNKIVDELNKFIERGRKNES